jgi:hypothetical protein
MLFFVNIVVAQQKGNVNNADLPEYHYLPEPYLIEACFKGGYNEFRRKVVDNFNTANVNPYEGMTKDEIKEMKENVSPIVLRTIVLFEVDKKGKITNVRAKGYNKSFNREAIKAVKRVKDKWKAERRNGVAVSSSYSIPLKIVFE